VRVEQAKAGQASPNMMNRVAFLPDNPELTDPFLMLAEDWVGAEGGFEMHPHRGFETVTLVLEGTEEHRDSTGQSGVLEAGDVQWMTAGRGVLHSEMPRGGYHALQLWVNLPADDKMRAPRYQNLPRRSIPTLEGDGARVRVIAGVHVDLRGVAETVTPMSALAADLAGGARCERGSGERAIVYVIAGTLKGHVEGTVLYLEPGRHSLRAVGETRLLWLEGRPIGEPVAAHGPFVMNTKEELVAAFRDLRAGRLTR
jgi:redox-sensitive bicupin YhaK (pirin superfamily)